MASVVVVNWCSWDDVCRLWFRRGAAGHEGTDSAKIEEKQLCCGTSEQ